jgi:sugar O-acyltransferase (sialic acid O-acetyltransferase NeuD family)
MRDLIICTTSAHARELGDIVDAVNVSRPTWNLLGFLAAGPDEPQDIKINGLPVLGSVEDLDRFSEACFLPTPFTKPFDIGPERVDPERVVSLVAPTAFVAKTATLGSGCILFPGCFVGGGARLGDGVAALANCVINHDDVLEDRVVLASGVTLAGSVHVETKSYLGQRCSVRQHLRIGAGSLIGMGAVVIKDVAPDSVMVGNPARRLRGRSDDA